MPRRCMLSNPRFVGDPVDVVTGEVRDIARDFQIYGERPFRWYRTYQSQRGAVDRGLGWGHRHVLDWVLRIDIDGMFLDTPDDPLEFPVFFAGDRRTAECQGWRLSQHGDALFRLERAREPIREFIRTHPHAIEARLHRLIHSDGSVTTLHYGTPERESLAMVVDSQGWTLQLDWSRGHIRAIRGRTPLGERVFIRYEYDSEGRLVLGRDAYGHTFAWAYDDQHRVTRRTDRRGYSFVYAYDGLGRCVRAAGEDDVDAVTLEYMPSGLETKVRHEANSATWIYCYDNGRNLLEIENPYGFKHQFLYDEAGRQTAEVDGQGELWTAVRDGWGTLIAKQDPLGHLHAPHEDITDPERDPLRHQPPGTAMEHEHGALIHLGFMAPSAAGLGAGLPEPIAQILLSAESMGIGHEIRDPEGLLLREETLLADGSRRQRRYGYDANGNVRLVHDHEGREWRYEYASWNHRVLERDPVGAETRYQYSQRDLIVAVEDPGGTRTEYEWDLCDRLAEVRRDGVVREHYIRDGAGHLIEKRGPEGEVLVRYERGPLGVLLRRWTPEGLEEHFERDERGWPRRARAEFPGTKPVNCEFFHDGSGRRTLDQRDGAGIEHEFLPSGQTETRFKPRVGSEGQVYTIRSFRTPEGGRVLIDPTGREHRIDLLEPGIVRRSFANGTIEVSQYNPSGRCVAKASQGRRGQWRRRFWWSPDGGLTYRQDDRRGDTQFTYDGAGRLHVVATARGDRWLYAHDLAGNLIAKPGLGEGFSDGSGPPLLGMDSAVAMAPGNRLYRANGDRFHYDARGDIRHRENRLEWTTYGRDGVGRLRTIHRTDTETRTSRLVWSSDYDALGRRVRKRVHEGERTRTWEFFWDGDRLAAEILDDGRLRVYAYADRDALVPMLAIEYASIESPPEDGRCHVLLADHRGAIEEIEDDAGDVVWSATVHPHAEVTADIGQDVHQPFRLVGQYWDEQAGLCIHRHRTWSPELGRFMESDPIGLEGGANLYAWPQSPLAAGDVLGLGCGDGDTSTSPKKDGDADEEGSSQKKQDSNTEGEEFSDWAASLPTKKTPTNTPKDLYEVAKTGPDNFRLSGGGEQVWTDGLDAASGAALEAKLVVKPDKSPFIPETNIPDFIRDKIVGEVTDEFRRYGAVIADNTNPVRQLTVFVNDQRAVPFFQELMSRFKIPGQILVQP